MSSMLFVSCGTEEQQVGTPVVKVSQTKLDSIFDNKNNTEEPKKKEDTVVVDKKDDSSDKKDDNSSAPAEKPEPKFPSVDIAPAFPSLKVNAFVGASYDSSLEDVSLKLWDLAQVCHQCKYEMPFIVEAKSFDISESEKLIWQKISKKVWIVNLKSSTFSLAKIYKSESKVIIDMETFDEATAKDLTTKTGLPHKSSFQKLMYRFVLEANGSKVKAEMFATGVAKGLISKAPKSILEKELRSSLDAFVNSAR